MLLRPCFLLQTASVAVCVMQESPDRSPGRPWLLPSYLYCCDLDDKLLFTDDSACGFARSNMTTAFRGSLDVCFLNATLER